MERRPEDLTLSEVMEHVRGSAEAQEKYLTEYEKKMKLPENFEQLGLTDKLLYVTLIAVRNQSRALTLMEQRAQKSS